MKISSEYGTNGYFIRSYSSERITIAYPQQSADLSDQNASLPGFAEETLESSFIMTAATLIRDWPARTISDLVSEHSEQLVSLKPEVIILGTGNKIAFPDMHWSATLYQNGIGLEVMDTGAACRTYSILAADGRNVAAALLLN